MQAEPVVIKDNAGNTYTLNPALVACVASSPNGISECLVICAGGALPVRLPADTVRRAVWPTLKSIPDADAGEAKPAGKILTP